MSITYPNAEHKIPPSGPHVLMDHRLSRRAFLRRSTGVAAAGILGAHGASALPHLQAAPRTLREKVEQLFVVSFRGVTAEPAMLTLLGRYSLGGVILFARNCRSATQVRALLRDLQQAARYPLLTCVDQEGGAVVRIRNGVHTFPSGAYYGHLGSTSRVYTDARTTARDLSALGVTLNLAPVVDVLGNARSPIGDRSYGPYPRRDASLTASAVRGYQQSGLAATAKHFIGLGNTSIDSHQALPTLQRTLAQLEQADLLPFRAAIGAGVSTVLVAHVALPKIDPVYRPASLSPVVVKGLLRQHLGFQGVVMTDSLIMGAIPEGGTAEAAERALAAGADILLIGTDHDFPVAVIDQAIERVVSAVRAGRVQEARLDNAVAHILAMKRRYPPANLRVA